MPEGAVYVGRPTRWGNPWKPGDIDIATGKPMDQARAVDIFAFVMSICSNVPGWTAPLRDATALACWCPLDQPCHADVLIELLEETG